MGLAGLFYFLNAFIADVFNGMIFKTDFKYQLLEIANYQLLQVLVVFPSGISPNEKCNHKLHMPSI